MACQGSAALPVPGAAAPQQLWSVTGGLSFLEPPTVLSWFPSLYQRRVKISSCFSQQHCRFYLRQEPTFSKDKMILIIFLSPALI